MLVLRFWYFLTGYVLINIVGPKGTKFLNLAAARGVFVWGVRRVDKGVLRACVGIQGYKALRKVSSATGCRVRMEGKAGLPFALRRLRARKAMLAGFAISVAVLWVLSNSIWFVRVSADGKEYAGTTKAIMRLLDKKGIEPGTPKSVIDTDLLSTEILESQRGLAWVGVTVKGTLLHVEYVKKVVPDKDQMLASHILAGADGVVTKLITFTGTPRVSEGDAVVKGQVLIEGRKPPRIVEEPGVDGGDPVVREIPGEGTRARGIVEASVLHEGYGEAYLRHTGTKRTGRTGRVVTVKAFGGSFQFGRIPQFGEYEVVTKRVFAKEWRKKRLPVEILETGYLETLTRTTRIPRSEAVRLAKAEALAMAKADIGGKDGIVRTDFEIMGHPESGDGGTGDPIDAGSDDGIVRVRAVIETVGPIGVEKRVETLPSNGGEES